jgi:hypothetical protein
MSLDLHLKYDINDEVYIKILGVNGIVTSIWIASKGIRYEIRYFYDGEVKEVYFYEQELTIKSNNKIGYNLKEK